MTLILEERLQYEDVRREADEDALEVEPRPHEESEEEIAVEEPEEMEENDGTALVQRPPRQSTATDVLWKALSDEEKQKLQESILDLLPDQANPEPSLTLLAMLAPCRRGAGKTLTTMPMSALPWENSGHH